MRNESTLFWRMKTASPLLSSSPNFEQQVPSLLLFSIPLSAYHLYQFKKRESLKSTTPLPKTKNHPFFPISISEKSQPSFSLSALRSEFRHHRCQARRLSSLRQSSSLPSLSKSLISKSHLSFSMMQPQIPLPRSHAEPPLLSSPSSNSAPTSLVAPAVAVTTLSFPHLCHCCQSAAGATERLLFVAGLASSLFSLSQNVAPLLSSPLSTTHHGPLPKLPFPVSECGWPSLSLHCQHCRRLPFSTTRRCVSRRLSCLGLTFNSRIAPPISPQFENPNLSLSLSIAAAVNRSAAPSDHPRLPSPASILRCRCLRLSTVVADASASQPLLIKNATAADC